MGNSQKLLYGLINFCLILFFIPQLSCNTTEPPDPKPDPALNLELEDVSCTEAWITLTTNNLQLPATLNLIKDNTITKTINLQTADTLLYIDSLLPNQTYNFKLSGIGNPASGINSNELSVTTMDTTSHNFTFQTWTFGTIGSSVLYDVAIIDENNIIAVGEIMVADSSPNGYTTYNAVHWDGNHWELLRIPYRDFGNHIVYGPLRTILAFSDSDIWFCSYADLVHYNGSNYLSKAFFMTGSNFNGQVSKMWGTDKNNIYCVGRSGSIYHYNGTGWKKIESGTDLNINDIWGDFNEKTGEWEILAVGSKDLPLRQGIFSIDKNSVMQISSYSIQWSLYALWFKTNRRYYVIGSGIYEKIFLNDSIWKDNGFNITHYATTGIRGNELNDVFATGAFGEFLHYNGINWKSYINELGLFSGSYGGIAVKNNLVVTVGYEGAQAKILLGRRIN